MKRLSCWLPLRGAAVLALAAGLYLPVNAGTLSGATVASSEVCTTMDSELPWSTVSAVLKRVSETHPYSYAQLVDGYQVGLVTVQALGSGYEVRIYDEDGLVDILIIEMS